MNKLYYNDLENIVLFDPALLKKHACSKLQIVTGFTDTERMSTHILSLYDGIKNNIYPQKMQVEVILGMTQGSGLTQKKHQDIVRTINHINSTSDMPRLCCRYIYRGKNTHTKLYIWENADGIPLLAFNGSANYSMQAFKYRRECMSECDPFSALKYYQLLLPDTVDCCDSDISNKIRFNKNNAPLDYDDPDNKDYAYYNSQIPVDTLKVSLLTAKGTVGYGSGINWGIRPNGTPRNPNQMYIPYNAQDRKQDFFPDRVSPSDKNCPVFRVITKDAGAFHMRMAQANNKALHSAESNSILGKWLRDKLHQKSGTFITLDMLKKYGKTSVTFRKYKDGTYLLDF